MLLEGTNNNTNGIICPKCGAVNVEDARFCESCGTDLGTAAGGAGQQNIPLGVNPQAQNSQYGNAVPSQSAGQDNTAPSQNLGQGSMVSSHGYGQGGSASGPYGSMPSQPQPAVKKPVPKWVPVLIAEAALLALSVYGNTVVLKNSKTPEQAAETFFVHIANGDWEEGYAQLDAEDSEFINAKMFAELHKQDSLGIVTNYQFNASYNSQAMDEISQNLYDWAEEWGIDEYMGQESGSTSLEKAVQIDYRVKGDTENSSYPIILNQTPEGWKVWTSNHICKDYYVYVPAGASATLDGIALGENYKVKEGEEGYQEDSSIDSYSIPQIFYGSHEIKITMEDMEDVTERFSINYGNSSYWKESMELKEEIRDSLIQKAGENMRKIYGAALAGKNFKTIEGLFSADGERRKEIKESYDSLMAELNEGNDITTRIAFQDITGVSQGSGKTVGLTFSYIREYKYKGWFGEWSDEQDDGSSELEFYFAKENGEWVQTNLGCENLYW